MPGSVQNAAPTTVLPAGLCSAFSEAREYFARANSYRNGERQVAVSVGTSRKIFTQTRRLTPAQMTALRNFYVARGGATEPFYFYHPYEHARGQPIGSNWDAGGASVTGRYIVRFEDEWTESMDLARGEAPLTLVELA